MTSRGAAVALVTFAAFTDLVAYSVAVPVLPDLSRRLGASPTVIGLLFSSFGLTLVLVSVPMGRVSDRIGRRLPLIVGMVALTASTLLFAYADSLAVALCRPTRAGRAPMRSPGWWGLRSSPISTARPSAAGPWGS